MNTGLSKSHIRSLEDIFPGDSMLLAPEKMLIHGTDAGRKFFMPWAVVRPETVDQVQEFMRLAHEEHIPVIPRARGTNVVSACAPDQGGVVLSCLKMNSIQSIDPEDFTALVQPGVITHDLQQQALRLGLFYPPDPASMRVSTIGGNIATNAGGMSAVKYGVTRDYVLGLQVVLPGGKVINTGGRVHKNVVGLDLTRLMVGSEGTLGIVVSAWLKLLPAPDDSATLLVCFGSEDAALKAVRDVFASRILPCAMEFFPAEVMRCLAGFQSVPWPAEAECALMIRVDGSKSFVRQQADSLQSFVKNAVYQDLAVGEDEERIWEIRRLINPASFRLGPDKAGDDVVVPRGRILEAIQGIRRTGAELGVKILAFGHIGDGNLHVNYMYKASDRLEQQAAAQAREQVLRLVLDLGGTISGEHGIGLAKKPFISWQLGSGELEIMTGIKKVFDPRGILNPGKAW